MRKLDPESKGASTLIGVRVSQATLEALDRLGAMAEIPTPSGPVRLPARSLSRAEALRIAAEAWLRSMGLLPSDIDSSATPIPAQTPQAPPASAIATPTSKAPSREGKALPLRAALLAALRAHTPESKARSIMVAPVVRELLAANHEQTLIFAELLALDREGVIELLPESGSGLLSKADKEVCPRGKQGPLSSAVWK